MQTPYRPDNKTQLPLEHYLKLYKQADVQEISQRTGVPYEGRFILNILGETKTASWPDFEAEGWSATAKILFLRYLLEGREAPPFTGFVTYRDMPWGDLYDVNFQGRCVKRLARTFGSKPEAFMKACEATGGVRISGSGICYELCLLKGLYLRFTLWEGDEEFAPNAQILFSDNFPQVFSAEDRVVVCEYTLDRLKKLMTA
jgi:hypothetical protein